MYLKMHLKEKEFKIKEDVNTYSIVTLKRQQPTKISEQ